MDREQARSLAGDLEDGGVVNALLAKLRASHLLRSLVLAERNTRCRLCDHWLGIQTAGDYRLGYNPRATRFRDPVGYEPIDYVLLSRYMKPVELRDDDVVFDIGCGMGRTVCLFARRQVKKCVGIEYVPELAAIAERNASRLRGRRALIEIRVADACEADYSGGTVFWMFNAFGEATLTAVLQRIEASLCASPRPVQLVYVNPRHESALHNCGWLRHVGNARSAIFRSYHASYWRGGPARAPSLHVSLRS